ncbi:MAG: leucyl aminopeptidase [Acidobacteria bacterium]|nr:MAG: leucyl aminopeptidase [Acidobacteriota bacterium]
MEIKGHRRPFHELDVDVLTMVVFEEETPENTPIMGELNERTNGIVGSLIASSELRGKPDEITYIHQPVAMRPRRVLLVGGGKKEQSTSEGVRRAAGTAARYLKERGLKSMGFFCRSEWALEPSARAAVEGVLLGLFDVGTYKTQEKDERFLEEIVIAAEGSLDALERALHRGQILAKATNFARNLVNEPSSILTPAELASRAGEMASRFNLDIEILDEQQMRELGMGALLAVARGSDEPAKLIILRYVPEEPRADQRSPVAFVGKGITFDSGGISLKPPKGMEQMKYDMAGGAAVLGAMRAIGQLRPPVPVMGIVPAAENMPSGRAQKPGDVVRSLSGKTIEVINTDAEGRLILADALTYACQLGARRVVDLATLTGACVVALGSVYAAVLGNDEPFLAEVIRASEAAGERLWRLPLDDAYRDQLRSEIADLKNIGGRKAGTITAASFLSEFVQGIPWAHIDIAGTAWLEEKKPYLATGPTGIGVRTLVHLAEQLGQHHPSPTEEG